MVDSLGRGTWVVKLDYGTSGSDLTGQFGQARLGRPGPIGQDSLVARLDVVKSSHVLRTGRYHVRGDVVKLDVRVRGTRDRQASTLGASLSSRIT